ncbi:hypothetical protein DL95DRAFT_336059 [Leptodontidium sp. 2 PMI_412]|nr:hypothetical protein DL95DRAFT_336059 [Leptodontidium sp. 2 PMI_412]
MEDEEEESDLSKQLADSESKFKVLTELNPVGMYYLSPDGNILYCNDMWYEITGHPRGLEGEMSFMNVIAEVDHPVIAKEWELLTTQTGKRAFELRLRNPWFTENGEARQKWIIASCDQEFEADGTTIKTIMGCITDISAQKNAQEELLARANLIQELADRTQEAAHHAEKFQLMADRVEAEEAKRHQETFIDMTSHEMRNPLSAIMLSADGIANSIIDFRSPLENAASAYRELLENNLDAAQTIVLCAQHQKRIIDDVLTLSKLNSALLQVTPVSVQVEDTVRRTLKMFESELLADNIQIAFAVEPSYHTSNIDFVFCDPVRLTQIFINLLTNAIKFTRSESTRSISVSLGASVNKPPKDHVPHIRWFPSKDSSAVQDLTLRRDWGTGQQVYLYFTVKDTGRGLSEQEKDRLFHRFSQASPKTHVQYGGSGLGLFISRELTELQGGEIGVDSKEGAGSTFAFYIKARRSVDVPSNPSNGSTPNLLPADTNHSSPRDSKVRRNYHILLVEDNLINQKVLSKQLRSAGCIVHVANHGGEAIDFLAKTALWHDCKKSGIGMNLSLILMDLEMPIMDGLACTRRIRDLENEGKIDGHVPIIAVTANTRMEQLEMAITSGMDDIVAKPFQIPELMQKMDRLLTSQDSSP